MAAGSTLACRPTQKQKVLITLLILHLPCACRFGHHWKASRQAKDHRRLSDSGSSNYPLFDVLECGPGWDFTQGGAKVLVAANGLDEKQMKEASSHIHVMFDRTEVH